MSNRIDSIGMFWEDLPKVKESKAKPQVVKMLPSDLGMDKEYPIPVKVRPELLPSPRPLATCDVECFPNYFLILFRRMTDGMLKGFEVTEDSVLDVEGLKDVLAKYEIVTFNGIHYDIPMIELAVTGASNSYLYTASKSIFAEELTSYKFMQKYHLTNSDLMYNHIDLVEVAPGVMDSLKIYGGRLHSRRLWDLPYPPDTVLTPNQMKIVRSYCGNDLETTEDLFLDLQPQIELRRAMSNIYKIDLRSKSDAQIAEEIIKSEIIKLSGRRLNKRNIQAGTFLYEAPDFIKFQNRDLKEALGIVTGKPFTITPAGRIEMPRELLTLKIELNQSTYQMGMGGLHSTEKSAYHIATNKIKLKDLDVTSYYPKIILNCRLYPPNLGRAFLDVYSNLVDERIQAKRDGDKVKAESLKITVNGSFGKLGSPYSALYAPELLVQVTVTGQLSLLMLIERLEYAGIQVVSANTDGIVAACPVELEDEMAQVVSQWEQDTGFEMEASDYRGLFSRDVNNYVAIKEDGSVKTKGCFSGGDLKKNPEVEICAIALINYLMSGKSFEDTIMDCKDITKFVTVRAVREGGEYKGQYLGKAVRWYYAKGSQDAILYKGSGKQVAKTMGCKPLMEIPPDFPEDVDYDWYIQECYKLL